MAKQVSTTYGEALFELAQESNELDNIRQEVNAVKNAFLENPELLKLLNHPKIVKEEKVKVIENIFTGRVSADIVGFLTLIVTKDRYNQIYDILEYFEHRYKEYKGIGVAYVTSAVELNDQQKKSIEERLLSTTKYDVVEANYVVDKSILGGLIIRIEDRVVDSSIKTQIEELEKSLYLVSSN